MLEGAVEGKAVDVEKGFDLEVVCMGVVVFI